MVMIARAIEILNKYKSRILLVAEASLPESQFKAFRKMVLDDLGKNGLEKELKELFDQQER